MASLSRATRRLLSTSIDAGRLVTRLTTAPKARVAQDKLVFGATTSDHMLEVDYDVSTVRRARRARGRALVVFHPPPPPLLPAFQGWTAPLISPYHAFELDPACNVFHYAIEAFEGMKAYLDASGRVRLFRPELNMRRMASSMARLALPALDEAGWLACIKRLVVLEKPWIPRGDGFSLYIRPTVIGTQPTLGVGPSRSLKLFTICCPVGPYYPEGFKPVKLLAETTAVRAWPGGMGDAKLGGNYAPTIRTQVAAAAAGFSQVLWLVGPEHAVTEVGTMNFFVLWVRPDGVRELITAPLDGTILPGVTRDSILALGRAWGDFAVTEGKFTMSDLTAALRERRVLEMFGAGTAAVVSPVQLLRYAGVDYNVPLDPADASAGAGPVTRRIWTELADVHYGRKQHTLGGAPWSVVCD